MSSLSNMFDKPTFLHRRPQKETPPGAAGKRQAAGGDMREGEWLAESDSAPRTGKAAQLLRQLSHPALAAGDVPVDDELLPAGPFLMGGHLGQQLCRRRSQPDGAGTLLGAGKLRLQLNVFIFPGTLPDAADGFLQLLGRTDGQVRQVMASDVFSSCRSCSSRQRASCIRRTSSPAVSGSMDRMVSLLVMDVLSFFLVA